MVSHNEYLPRGGNGNALSATANGNVSVASLEIHLATIQNFNFVQCV